ncbi:MAG TPA: OmpA family protein [Kofleriaceae bacterium]|jgi:outer membrane protein OmpA-like peptidoglycan-associated protein|nr:OmpA family protein [Kofleriaceae bacterium]
MKTLTFVMASMLVGSTLAAADPDFTLTTPPPPARPAQAASDGTSPIEPTTLVNFANDSYQLDSAGVSQVSDIAAWMKAHPSENVVVQGFTDRSGSHAYNAGLAKHRAERVRDHIVQQGVAAERIVVATYGDRDAARREDESDRRVIVFASTRAADELAASVLASTKADEVVWTSNGSQLQERRDR